MTPDGQKLKVRCACKLEAATVCTNMRDMSKLTAVHLTNAHNGEIIYHSDTIANVRRKKILTYIYALVSLLF